MDKDNSNSIAEKILTKDLENIVRKVAQGKTLTVAERLRIESEYGIKEKESFYANNLVELASVLDVSRGTIDRWRKYRGAPQPFSNGQHSIAKWREFVRLNDLKESDSPEDAELKSRKLLAEVRQAELKLKVMEAQYVSVETIQNVWTQHIGQARQIQESRFLNELPPLLATLNAVQIRQKLQEALDESYATICVSIDEIKEPISFGEEENIENGDNAEDADNSDAS